MIDAQLHCNKCGGALRIQTVTQTNSFWQKLCSVLIPKIKLRQRSVAVCQICGKTIKIK